jgi:hypothetical protein
MDTVWYYDESNDRWKSIEVVYSGGRRPPTITVTKEIKCPECNEQLSEAITISVVPSISIDDN